VLALVERMVRNRRFDSGHGVEANVAGSTGISQIPKGWYGTRLEGIDIFTNVFEGWRGRCGQFMSVYHTHFLLCREGLL
jgi:hypothetical protein